MVESDIRPGDTAMSFRIVESAVAAERSYDLHEGRLLLLLMHQADRGDGSVNGIMKLAKMDFLLRYPVYFERLLKAIRKRPPQVIMQQYERDTVESRMIRFRYGPWDPRYRRWLGILAAKGLVNLSVEGRTVHVRLADKGKAVAKEISSRPEFGDLNARSEQVARSVGSMSGSNLKDLVYKVVPELTGMDWGEEIVL